MDLKIFKTLWGHIGSFESACADAVKVGFDGIEGPSHSSRAVRNDYQRTLNDHGLEYIAEITTGGSYVPDAGSNPGAHFASFQRKLEHSLELNPRFINCLAGSDLWPFSDTVSLFQKVLELANENDVAVAFETHRSRSTFPPLVTTKLLSEIPELQLTVDFSHWCCVFEKSCLGELPEGLELCAKEGETLPGAGRLGQGPQVPDPRAAEYAHA